MTRARVRARGFVCARSLARVASRAVDCGHHRHSPSLFDVVMRFACAVVGANASAVDASVEVTSRGIRIDRVLGATAEVETPMASTATSSSSSTRAQPTPGALKTALLGKFPCASVVNMSFDPHAREVVLQVAIQGGQRVIRLRCARASEATSLRDAIETHVGSRARRDVTEHQHVSTQNNGAMASSALVRDLREENALLSDALRAAEEALKARDGVDDGDAIDRREIASYEIKLRNMAKTLEYHQSRSARLADDVAEHARKLERYRSLESVLTKENEELRANVQEMKAARDSAVRRAEAAEVLCAHAKNEVAALSNDGSSSEASSSLALGELQRELAVVESARSTAETHLNLTLAHLRAARDENVKLTEDLLKKTNESFEREARVDELEQMIDMKSMREGTSSKELAIALQDRTEAINRAKMFETELKQVKIEVERLVGRLGDAERAALAEKEELRATCAARIEEYATEMSKQTAAARDAAIEAQKQASLVHDAHVKTQELEYELHEERRRRIELERSISHMELAKQTIADFTADAEASVLRSIQAQRDANVELQRLRVEKHDLHGQLSASKNTSSASPAPSSTHDTPQCKDEGWRRQLTATLDLHKTLRGGSPQAFTPSNKGASWNRVTNLTGGAAFAKPPSSAQRLKEIEAEISMIKSRQTPVKASLETKFNLHQGPRVVTAYETPGK